MNAPFRVLSWGVGVQSTTLGELSAQGELPRLDAIITADTGWERKVVERILHNLSLLFERSFGSVQELNRYRKELAARLAAQAGSLHPAAN